MYEELIEELKRGSSKEDVAKIKHRFAKKHALPGIPSNSEILEHASEDDLVILKPILKKKPIRTASGIAVVAVMARPAPCPGECIYCPKGDEAPQSYTGYEPAALRARRADYDPYKQTHGRLKQLEAVGHDIDKVELIVMGGTFLAQDTQYQEHFVARCLQAMNDFPGGSNTETSLHTSQVNNESATHRNVGITFETRPDFSKETHTDMILAMGGTRVELGVQTLHDHIYQKVNRGHSVEDVMEATRILKDSGLKVGYHMMPGLFSSPEDDLETFKALFADSRFKPDMLKIYPTLVMEGTSLYDIWKRGEYTPPTDDQILDLLVDVKKIMPKWVRTMRIQRDIPRKLVAAGILRGDMGAMVYEKLKEEGIRCQCIRCRDVGHLEQKEGVKVEKERVQIMVEKYNASGGTDIFISAEDKEADALVGFLRLRFPSTHAHRPEITDECVLIRELRVLGPMVPLGKNLPEASQHVGWGSVLLKKAEEQAADSGKGRILVTSAIGTREYYSRLGYQRNGPYMEKIL